MAWLSAKPEKKKETRAQEYRARYGEHCPELDLPEVDGGEHIIDYLFEVGPVVRGEELTHGDLWHWQQNTGAELCEFEASELVRLSRLYLGSHQKYGKTCPPPWRRERTADEKAERARQQIAARKARQQQGKQ